MTCFISFVFVDGNSCFSLQTDSGARVARNLNFSRDLLFFPVVLLQSKDVKALAGSTCGQGDLFSPTHWSVVLAAGKSEAEPEGAPTAPAELFQKYLAPPFSFVRRRGY